MFIYTCIDRLGCYIMVTYFQTFGSPCYILKDQNPKGKFDTKSNEGILVSYSTNNRAYRVLNTWTRTIMDYISMVIGDY